MRSFSLTYYKGMAELRDDWKIDIIFKNNKGEFSNLLWLSCIFLLNSWL